MHCLNLKITYECTNKCSFCFSSYLKETVINMRDIINALKSGFKNGCRELVISGGEPTLFPNKIKKIIDISCKLGYEEFIIQTNGSGLSGNCDLVKYLNEMGKKVHINISFSIHGHNSTIHDKMTSTPGSFKKLIDSIEKISNTSCNIYTNTVISALNINHLKEISLLLNSYPIKVMQFSIMHLDHYNELSVKMSDAAQAIKNLNGIVDRKVLRTEGIPYCLLYGMEECVGESYWPNKLDLYNKKNDYMPNFDQLTSGMRWKSSLCSKCIMNELCAGMWKEHSDEFLSLGVKPIY